MGLLDDAIRQHLELKRQHGAPEEEVQRQEEEALGPARRDVAPPEPAGNGDVELEAEDEAVAAEAGSERETELFEPDEMPVPELEEQESVVDEPGFDEPPADFDEPEPAPSAGPAMPFEPDEEPEQAPAAGPDTPFEPDEEPEPEGIPEPDALPPSPAPFDAETAFQEFAEQDEEDEQEEPEPEGEAERDDADVLEDTPDFLQETPEHDRLWFEQKPPRDFDFD